MVKVGSTLSATPASVTGDPTPVRSWQWLRDNVTISGATAANYYVQAADEGAKLSVRQIETNFVGVATATSAQTATVGAYDPGTLFESGEVGAWYDPSDLTTVFQDAAGTTPATVGDPVGLILDKSKGLVLGSELVTNGTFDTDTSGWTAVNGTLAWNNGAAELTSTAVQQVRASQAFTTVVGKTYKASATIWQGTTTVALSLLIPGLAQSAFVLTNTPTTVSVIFKATSTSTLVYPGSYGGMPIGETCYVDNVSVRELPGNHATQTTSAARPVLQSSGGLYYLDFDGVDDLLSTTFAAAQSQPNTIAAGLKFDQGSRLEFIVDGVGAQSQRLGKATTDLSLNAGISITDPSAIGTSERVALGVLNTTSSDLRIDGQSVITGNVGTFQWTGVTLGAARFTDYWADGRIYGFVGVDRTLTAGEISDLESYLASKSGVTL